MKAGPRDARIAIAQPVAGTADAYGEAPVTWSLVGYRWAEALPVSDGERMANNQPLAVQMYRFRVLYDVAIGAINPTWRVTYQGRLYDVTGVKELGRNEGLEITATARVDG